MDKEAISLNMFLDWAIHKQIKLKVHKQVFFQAY